MSTTEPTRWKPKNVHEELWNIVDLHVRMTVDSLQIDVHAVETGADDFTEETGRCLLTVSAHVLCPFPMDVSHSSWDLDDVIRDEWKVPPPIANLLHYAADMGLAVVRMPGQGFTGTEEEVIPLDLVDESEAETVTRLVEQYGVTEHHGPEVPC